MRRIWSAYILGVLTAAVGAAALLAQSTPLTPLSNLGLRADNGALHITKTGTTFAVPAGPLTNGSNIQVRATDGALNVVCPNCGTAPSGSVESLVLSGPGTGSYDGRPGVLVINANSQTEWGTVWVDPASAANQQMGALYYSNGNFTFRAPNASGALVTTTIGSTFGIFTDGTIQADGYAAAIRTVSTGPYTITQADSYLLCNATTAGINLNLPSAIGQAGRIFALKKIDPTVNGCSFVATGGQTIDGAPSDGTGGVQNTSIRIISDNANWQRW